MTDAKCNFLYNVIVNYMFCSYEYKYLGKEYYFRKLIIPLESSKNGFQLIFDLRYKVCEIGNQPSEEQKASCYLSMV